MILVGLTGGIASGKSSVAKLLKDKGSVIIDADVIGQRTYSPGGPAYQPIIDRFGEGVVGNEGQIDRAQLGAIVFEDPDALADLNSITHPLILDEVVRKIDAHRDTDQVVVLDAALLVEIFGDRGRTLGIEALVVVIASPEQQIERLVADRGMSRKKAQARIDAQGLTEAKMAAADYVLDNREGLAELEASVDKLWEELRPKATAP